MQCQNCYDFAVDCTYNRPSKRRKHGKDPDGSLTRPFAPASLMSPHAPSASVSTPTEQSIPSSNHHRHSHVTGIGEADDFDSATYQSRPLQTGSDMPEPHPSTFNVQSEQQPQPVSSFNLNPQLSAPSITTEELSVAWRAFALSCETAISELMAIYMDVVYPT